MSLTVTAVQLFEPVQLTGAAVAIYTVPASPTTTLMINGRVRFTNTTASIQTVTAYAVPSGGSPGATNCIANAESIPPNSHLDLDLPQLAAGDSFQALAGNATSVTVSALGGTVVTP